jgi:hypothetical protein
MHIPRWIVMELNCTFLLCYDPICPWVSDWILRVCCTALYCTVLYSTVLLYCAVLYCTALLCSSLWVCVRSPHFPALGGVTSLHGTIVPQDGFSPFLTSWSGILFLLYLPTIFQSRFHMTTISYWHGFLTFLGLLDHVSYMQSNTWWVILCLLVTLLFHKRGLPYSNRMSFLELSIFFFEVYYTWLHSFQSGIDYDLVKHFFLERILPLVHFTMLPRTAYLLVEDITPVTQFPSQAFLKLFFQHSYSQKKGIFLTTLTVLPMTVWFFLKINYTCPVQDFQ